MGIGTSKGAFYEDEFEYLRSQWDRKFETNDQNVIHPNQVERNKELDQVETDPTTGLGIEASAPATVANAGFLDRLSIVNTFKGMMNPSIDEDKAIAKGVKDSVVSGATLPGDVYQGKVDPTSGEAVERAFDLAGTAVLGSAPVAKAVGVDGTLGSIAGVKSKNIEGRVGKWWKGSDGKMRHEISDQGMKLSKELTEGASGKLSEFLDHPELFKAYPQLKDINFAVTPGNYPYLGGYSESTKTLMINPSKIRGGDDHILDVLSHELQHAVQGIEGFSRGSNPNVALERSLTELGAKIVKMPDGPDKDSMKTLLDDIFAKASDFGDYMYRRAPGEVEANTVAARRQLTDEQRKLMSPDEMNKAFEGEVSNLHGGRYVPEFNYPDGSSPGGTSAMSKVSEYPYPMHFEEAATKWAQGKMTGKEFREMVRKEGWTIDPYELQRSTKSTVDVFDPSGKMHEIQP